VQRETILQIFCGRCLTRTAVQKPTTWYPKKPNVVSLQPQVPQNIAFVDRLYRQHPAPSVDCPSDVSLTVFSLCGAPHC
jgi:hypothetical protein